MSLPLSNNHPIKKGLFNIFEKITIKKIKPILAYTICKQKALLKSPYWNIELAYIYLICIDPAYELEPMIHQILPKFSGKIILQKVILEAKNNTFILPLWLDKSKMEVSEAKAAVV